MNTLETSLVHAEVRKSQPKQGEAREVVRIAFRPTPSAKSTGQIDIEKASWDTFANELLILAEWIRKAPSDS